METTLDFVLRDNCFICRTPGAAVVPGELSVCRLCARMASDLKAHFAEAGREREAFEQSLRDGTSVEYMRANPSWTRKEA